MSGLITTAASQYATRPADERYPSLDALIQAARYDKEHSAERTYNLKDLRAVAATPAAAQVIGAPLILESPKGIASFTHYSFGQLARTIGAPAAYLRTLPPSIAADAINFGLQDSTPGTAANLLLRSNGGTPVVRAATSETYGRVWDADLYAEVARHFGDDTPSRSAKGGSWIAPPAWPELEARQGPGGNYRGDRDSFVIRVDGGSIVTDPSAGQNGQMYRGLMIRNSEVGHASITIECILFRYICGNHNLWGAIMDRQFRRRHVGTRITRDTMRELTDLAWKFNQRSASTDEQIIRTLIDREIAHTREAVIDELKKIGMTKAQATDAYAMAEQHEQASPRSYWGAAQGLTRMSQASGYQDERLMLDQFAAAVLARGAKLVTV